MVHEDDYKPHIITAKLKEDLSGWDTVRRAALRSYLSL